MARRREERRALKDRPEIEKPPLVPEEVFLISVYFGPTSTQLTWLRSRKQPKDINQRASVLSICPLKKS